MIEHDQKENLHGEYPVSTQEYYRSKSHENQVITGEQSVVRLVTCNTCLPLCYTWSVNIERDQLPASVIIVDSRQVFFLLYRSKLDGGGHQPIFVNEIQTNFSREGSVTLISLMDTNMKKITFKNP